MYKLRKSIVHLGAYSLIRDFLLLFISKPMKKNPISMNMQICCIRGNEINENSNSNVYLISLNNAFIYIKFDSI
jgi:hypothetical protein